MKIKKELQTISAGFGVKVGGYQSHWEEAQSLGIAHSVGAVVRDFTSWMQENQGDDFPSGALPAYLFVADSRLRSSLPTISIVKDPEVVSLCRELAYLSDGAVVLGDKQKIKLAEVLQDFSAKEIASVFKSWLDDQDLSNPKNLSYLPGNFVQKADGLCYAARRKKEEADAARISHAAHAKRLSEQAEAERAEREKQKLAEEANNPLADLFE